MELANSIIQQISFTHSTMFESAPHELSAAKLFCFWIHQIRAVVHRCETVCFSGFNVLNAREMSGFSMCNGGGKKEIEQNTICFASFVACGIAHSPRLSHMYLGLQGLLDMFFASKAGKCMRSWLEGRCRPKSLRTAAFAWPSQPLNHPVTQCRQFSRKPSRRQVICHRH